MNSGSVFPSQYTSRPAEGADAKVHRRKLSVTLFCSVTGEILPILGQNGQNTLSTEMYCSAPAKQLNIFRPKTNKSVCICPLSLFMCLLGFPPSPPSFVSAMKMMRKGHFLPLAHCPHLAQTHTRALTAT